MYVSDEVASGDQYGNMISTLEVIARKTRPDIMIAVNILVQYLSDVSVRCISRKKSHVFLDISNLQKNFP